MKYLVLLSMSEDVGAPPPELMTAMDTAMREAFASGTMIDAGGLGATADATTWTLRSGALDRVDGPYAEAKEVVGGYSMLDVASREEAVEMARRMMELHRMYWPGWQGNAEVRPVFGAGPAPGGQPA